MTFLWVYIREVHPVDGWPMAVKDKNGRLISDPITLEQRQMAAGTACTHLHIEFPTVVDNPDDRVSLEYSAWPDRLYVIKPDGTIGFKSAPGPNGWVPKELIGYLKQVVKVEGIGRVAMGKA